MNPIHTHHLLSAMYAQSLDGIFFMMLDEPIHWHDSVDKEAVLDYVLTHHRITDGNAAFYTQHRTRPDKLKGLTPLDFFPDRAEVRKRWRTFLDEEHIHLEIELTRLDGSPLLVEGDYSWLKDDHGAYIGSFGIQRRYHREKADRTSNCSTIKLATMRSFTSATMLSTFSITGTPCGRQSRASEMLGYSLEELHTISYLETSGERDASEAVLRRLRAGELVPTYKRIFIKKSGERFPVEIQRELVRDSEGTPLYLQSTVRDISRREALQNELARRAANAEAMNRIVDACLVNETLDPIFERALAELAQLFAVDGGLGLDAVHLRLFELAGGDIFVSCQYRGISLTYL